MKNLPWMCEGSVDENVPWRQGVNQRRLHWELDLSAKPKKRYTDPDGNTIGLFDSKRELLDKTDDK